MSLAAELQRLPVPWVADPDLPVTDEFALRTALNVTAAAMAGLVYAQEHGDQPDLYGGTALYQLDPKGCNPPVPYYVSRARGSGDCQDLTAWRSVERRMEAGRWPVFRLADGNPVHSRGKRLPVIHVLLEDEDPSLTLARAGRFNPERRSGGPECSYQWIEPDDQEAGCGGCPCSRPEAGADWFSSIGEIANLLGQLIARAANKGDDKGKGKGKGEDKPTSTRSTTSTAAPASTTSTTSTTTGSGEGDGWAELSRLVLGLVDQATQEAGAVDVDQLNPLLREMLDCAQRLGLQVEPTSGKRSTWRQIELWEERMRAGRAAGEDAPASWADVESDWSRWRQWVWDEWGGLHGRAPLAPPGVSAHQAEPWADAVDVRGSSAELDRMERECAPEGVRRPLASEPWHFRAYR